MRRFIFQAFRLEHPSKFHYTDRMKNKNNVTVKQMVDKLNELKRLDYKNDPANRWAYVAGVLEAMMDWELKGYDKGSKTTFQDRVNEAYERYSKELQSKMEMV